MQSLLFYLILSLFSITSVAETANSKKEAASDKTLPVIDPMINYNPETPLKTDSQTQTEVVPEETPLLAPTDPSLSASPAPTNPPVLSIEKPKILRQQRPYGVYLHYSPLDLIIPSKIGASFYFSNSNRTKQYEIQYLSASISTSWVDLGSIKDQRISFLVRSFNSATMNSFNLFYGVSYNSLKVSLGDDFLNTVPPQDRPHADLVELESINLDLGLGNRWYYKNLTVSFDWLGLSQPVSALKKSAPFLDETSNQSKKDDVKSFLNLATYLPRFYVLKFSVGYAF